MPSASAATLARHANLARALPRAMCNQARIPAFQPTFRPHPTDSRPSLLWAILLGRIGAKIGSPNGAVRAGNGMPDRQMKRAPVSYREAGVDIDAGNALVEAIKPLASATRRAGAEADLGGFGGLFDLKRAGFRDPILVAANDGVGTKLKIAIDLGRHDTIGIDLVAMCVNDLLAQGAEPLFFLDYFACGKLDVEVARTVVCGIAGGCRQAGCALIGGETAEMPGPYESGG